MRSGILCMLLAVLCGIIATASPPAISQTGRPSVPFVTLAQGTKSNIRIPTQMVIRNQAAWRALWRRHSRTAPPSVTFNRHMVIAVFAGEFPEPAGIAVMRIIRGPDRLIVLYRGGPTRPLPNGGGIRTTPFHIVRTARSTLPVDFKKIKTAPIVRQPQP